MSRYDHKIETSLEGIEHLSKEKKVKINDGWIPVDKKKVKRSLQSCLSIRMKEESEEGIGRL